MNHYARFRTWTILALIGIAVAAFRLLGYGPPDIESGYLEMIPPQEQEIAFTLVPVSSASEFKAKCFIAAYWLDPTREIITSIPSTKTFSERLGYTLIIGLIEGWKTGIERAKIIALPTEALDEARQLRDKTIVAMEKRSALEKSGDAAGLNTLREFNELRPILGYFADSIGPNASLMIRRALAQVAMEAGILIAFVTGFACISILAIRALSGKIRSRLASIKSTHAALVIGETFLLWITLVLLCDIAADLGLWGANQTDSAYLIQNALEDIGLLFISLTYPIMRGITWHEIRNAIGLNCGQGVFHEIFQGIVCFLSELPLAVLLVIIASALTLIPSEKLTDPYTEILKNSNTPTIHYVMIFFSLCIITPIIEEILFRGFLYGYLRSTVVPHKRFVSISVAAIVSSLAFGLIHPYDIQGNTVISVGAVFYCLFRETRGSLIATMVAHAIHNTACFTKLISPGSQ